MTDALKRIEEKLADLRRDIDRDPYDPGLPAVEGALEDVVKLARALDHALEWLREEGCDCGDEPGTCALCEAERTLKEVAGE